MITTFKTGTRGAFTLIELLIVVAIIAILAAIAVPNFLEAQTRAKISRAKADMRTVSTGLEMYRMDNKVYIYGNGGSRALHIGDLTAAAGHGKTLERLSTPISYLTSKSSYRDPFKGVGNYQGNNLENKGARSASYPTYEENGWYDHYWYSPRSGNTKTAAAAIWSHLHNKPEWYLLESAGPDGHHHNLGGTLNNMKVESDAHKVTALMAIYNATNGTMSRGSIFRADGNPVGTGVSFFKAVKEQD